MIIFIDKILIKPTYDDLLAKAYIKLAHALLRIFLELLIETFGVDNVLIAPIKELMRCKAKLNEIKEAPNSKPPYASKIGDYLRATVLCSSLEGMVTALGELSKIFQIVRVKPRVMPTDAGNKVILVNILVEDKRVKARSYAWSGWWDNQPVRMIAEVCAHVHKHYLLFILLCYRVHHCVRCKLP